MKMSKLRAYRERWFNKLLTYVFGRRLCKKIRNIQPPSTTASSNFSNPKKNIYNKMYIILYKMLKSHEF